MITLLQRVNHARVEVDQVSVGEIGQGLLVFAGIEKNDCSDSIKRMFDRIVHYRVFADSKDKMNLSVLDLNAEILLVPQFTLTADTNKGRRPSFTSGGSPEHGENLFNELVEYAKTYSVNVQTGVFKANMQVFLQNDGPATFILKSKGNV